MGCCSPKNNNNMCYSGCCGNLDESQIIEDCKIKIDFLYLDLDICNQCQGTDEGLDEAKLDRITDYKNVLIIKG